MHPKRFRIEHSSMSHSAEDEVKRMSLAHESGPSMNLSHEFSNAASQ